MPVSPRSARAMATFVAAHSRLPHRPKLRQGAKLNPKKPREPEPKPKPVYMRSTIAAISNILRYSTWDSAQAQLRSLPLRWDSYTVNQVLKTHPPMEKAWLFFSWASRLPNFKHDRFTYTTMLDIFGEAGRVASMRHLLDEMLEKGIEMDAATYTSAMHWLAKDGDLEGAVRVWGEMRRCGCCPTVVSYTAIMKVLLDHGRPKEASGVYKEMIEAGVAPNCHTYTVLMDYLAGTGNFTAALEIMNKMQEAGVLPDKAACNILVQKCSQAGESSAMFHILRYMKEHLIVLRHPVFLEALQALKHSGESDQLLREVNPHLSSEGVEEEMLDFEATALDTMSYIDRGIILNLLARQNFIAIEYLLSGMIKEEKQLDSELVSAVVQANCSSCRLSGALMAFHFSVSMKKKLDRDAYVSLIGLFVRTKDSQKILDVVEEMAKAGIALGTYLVSSLIYRLGFAGLSAFAARIFYSFPEYHNTVTCTALMYAYFRASEIDKGLDIFSTMTRHGVPASCGTYEVLIGGLEEAGRINDAEIYRKEKKRLQWHDFSKERISAAEILCDRLFDCSP